MCCSASAAARWRGDARRRSGGSGWRMFWGVGDWFNGHMDMASEWRAHEQTMAHSEEANKHEFSGQPAVTTV